MHALALCVQGGAGDVGDLIREVADYLGWYPVADLGEADVRIRVWTVADGRTASVLTEEKLAGPLLGALRHRGLDAQLAQVHCGTRTDEMVEATIVRLREGEIAKEGVAEQAHGLLVDASYGSSGIGAQAPVQVAVQLLDIGSLPAEPTVLGLLRG